MAQFRELLARLADSGLDFIVVGGVAATLHGASEPTRDLDVCIRPSPDTWARVHAFLAPLHPRFALAPDRRPMGLTSAELAGFKNLYVLTDLGRLDFLGEVPPLGSIDELAPRAVTMHVAECSFRVIALSDLLAVKEFVGRPKDLQVAAELRAIRDATKK